MSDGPTISPQEARRSGARTSRPTIKEQHADFISAKGKKAQERPWRALLVEVLSYAFGFGSLGVAVRMFMGVDGVQAALRACEKVRINAGAGAVACDKTELYIVLALAIFGASCLMRDHLVFVFNVAADRLPFFKARTPPAAS